MTSTKLYDIKRFWIRFWEFGGFRLLREYARMGLVFPLVRALWQCVLRCRPAKNIYSVIFPVVEKELTAKYSHILREAVLASRQREKAYGKVPPIIWTCWLQGVDQASDFIHICLASQRKCWEGFEQRILTLDNCHEWVDIPQFVIDKYVSKKMPAALFSDILRLAVLKKYGGIWLDASVFCTGFSNESLQKQREIILDSPFTIFRYYRRGEKQPSGLSSWFIAVPPGSEIAMVVYDMLVAYWRDYDCTIDYYLIHLFLSMSLRAYPEIERRIPKINSRFSMFLGDAFAQTWYAEDWEDLVAHVAIHKVNFRKVEWASKNPDGYCSYILKNRKCFD